MNNKDKTTEFPPIPDFRSFTPPKEFPEAKKKSKEPTLPQEEQNMQKSTSDQSSGDTLISEEDMQKIQEEQRVLLQLHNPAVFRLEMLRVMNSIGRSLRKLDKNLKESRAIFHDFGKALFQRMDNAKATEPPK